MTLMLHCVLKCCLDHIQRRNHDKTCPTAAAKSVDGSGKKLNNAGNDAVFTESCDGVDTAPSEVDELWPRQSDGEAEAYAVRICDLATGNYFSSETAYPMFPCRQKKMDPCSSLPLLEVVPSV